MARKATLTVLIHVELPDDFPDERVGNLCLQLDTEKLAVDTIDGGLVQGAVVYEFGTISAELVEG